MYRPMTCRIAAHIESLGGKNVVPPVPIPSGTFAWFSDPEGNVVGLWKPATGHGL